MGSIVDSSGTCEKDIDNRISQARKITRSLNGILWNREMTKTTKKRILNTMVESVLLYGSECWTLNDRWKKKLESTEMDGLRRSMRVSRLQHIRNDFIRAEMEAERTVVNRIEERILQWYGHVQRMEEERWPRRVIHWTPIGRRKRGRARISWCDSVRKVMTIHDLEDGQWNDRSLWRTGIRSNR